MRYKKLLVGADPGAYLPPPPSLSLLPPPPFQLWMKIVGGGLHGLHGGRGLEAGLGIINRGPKTEPKRPGPRPKRPKPKCSVSSWSWPPGKGTF